MLRRSMMQIRFDSKPAATSVLTVAAALLWVLLFGPSTRADAIPDTVVDIRVEGNETIPASWILQRIQTQPGRKLTERMIREDKRELLKTRLFGQVLSQFKETSRGAVLVYRVTERPIVRSVKFVGNKKIKDKVIRSWTGLEAGSPYDPMANKEAVERIKQEYKEKGHYHVRVELRQGSQPSDRDVIIEIKEGPVVRVTERVFEGVEQLWDDRIKTKLATKASILGLFRGIYRPETLAQDEAAILKYYRNLGYFDATAKAEPLFSPEDGAKVRVVYHVHEG